MPTARVIDPLTEAGFVYGQDPAIRSVNAMVREISRTDIPVLITGESGAGKEVYARLLHRLSGVSAAPLKKLSCTMMEPDRLLTEVQESLRPSMGSSRAGTLLLDSIDELDLTCQRALLSLLPDGEAQAGSGELSARLISSTRRNLEKEVEAGRFRRELYFRINGVTLRLPALRGRKQDIPALAEHFLMKHAGEMKKNIPVLNSEAMELLISYDWPGNIRELENVAKKMVALGNTELALGDLRTPTLSVSPGSDGPRVSSLKVAARIVSRQKERELILKALEHTRWNRKRAAQELQISYKSLLYKIKQIGMQASESGE